MAQMFTFGTWQELGESQRMDIREKGRGVVASFGYDGEELYRMIPRTDNRLMGPPLATNLKPTAARAKAIRFFYEDEIRKLRAALKSARSHAESGPLRPRRRR